MTLLFFFFFNIAAFIYLFLNFIYLFIWLCWVFVSVRGLSLVAASGDHSSSRCAGLSLSRPLVLRSTGSRRTGSVVVAQGPSCSAACGIFPDRGSNPCPLHWQADSQPLRHQGSPPLTLLMNLPQRHRASDMERCMCKLLTTALLREHGLGTAPASLIENWLKKPFHPHPGGP